jgi:DNA mismatch repair ATPase MutS
MINETKSTLPADFYNNQLKQLAVEIDTIKRKKHFVSLYRLLSFAAIVTCFVFLNKTGNYLYLLLAVILIIVFFWLIKLSVNLKETFRFKKELVKINQNELKALNANYSVFESGEEFIASNHPFAFDLDIFGQESIFQVLNRTSTHAGKQYLANMLAAPCLEKEQIMQNQASIKELRDKIKWRQKFQAVGQLEKDTARDRKNLELWLNMKGRFFGKKAYAVLGVVLPVLTILAWVLYGFSVIPLIFPFLFSLTQLLITVINIGYVNKRQSIVNKQIKTLKKFHELIDTIEKETFKSTQLKAIQNQTLSNGVKPSKSFKELIKHVDALDNRMNVIVGFLLNSLLLWDINYMIKIEKWIDEFKATFPNWVDAIARFDAFSSLACFMYNNREYAIPQVAPTGKFLLKMVKGGHPLVNKEDLITNDLYQDERLNLFLITGANMAGKSTFLRTVGLNLILAMSGTCVCAKEFVFTPVQLYTSMRTNDSLQKQTSFFFAELKKLQFVINKLRKDQKSYILLDEILKGTNSKDQHTGSARLIENIIALNGFGMVATHDIELTDIAQSYPGKIRNIAFEIEMKNNQMVFDYKYKDGVCKNMNATLLMEQMNIFN